MPSHLTDIKVQIPAMTHFGNLNDVDMMLESPDGKQVVFLSDVDVPGLLISFADAKFSSKSDTLLDYGTFFPNACESFSKMSQD